MSGLAEGCCSAVSPCSHQRISPNTICETCISARNLTAATPKAGTVAVKPLPYPPIVMSKGPDGADHRVGVHEYRTPDRLDGIVTIAVFLGKHRWAEAELSPTDAKTVSDLILSRPSVAALVPSPSVAEAAEPVAAIMTVIDPDAWEPCSPAYLAAGGDCASAPRVWNALEMNHWHPKLPHPAPPSPVPDGLEALVERTTAAYDLVKLWPENRMTPGATGELGKGFTDLLELRNLVSELLAAITALKAERDEVRQQARTAAIATIRQANCIHLTAQALGPDYAATVDALPKAAKHRVTELITRAETAERDLSAAEEVIRAGVTAWEKLPSGNHSKAVIQDWLVGTMWPAINHCRDWLAGRAK